MENTAHQPGTTTDDPPAASTQRPAAVAVDSPWHRPAAALAAVAAVAHLPLLDGRSAGTPYLGALVVLWIGACAALAARLWRLDDVRTWTAAALLPAAALVTYAVSRTVGLPLSDGTPQRWAEPLGLVAGAAETALLVIALVVLRARTAAPSAVSAPSAPSGQEGTLVAEHLARRPVTTAAVLVLGAAAVLGASVAPSGAPAGDALDATLAVGSGTGDYWKSVAGAAFKPTGRTRTYYVRAEEVEWNYAPAGKNLLTDSPFDETADVFVKTGPGRVGSTYLKCLYVGYTDATFGTRAKRATQDAYLGFMGPVIRAEVGDTIKVVFRNSCRMPTSVHPHGVFYEKASEGAPYSDTTSGSAKADDAVPTGGSHTYTWRVPERAGPGPMEGSSVMWMYHSHSDEIGDTYAGLQGFMVVTARGMARADGSPKDVDREVFELFEVMNENNSPYLDENVERFADGPPAEDDEDGFEESNLMHSINGYVYGNQPLLTLKKGQRVRWYLMGMGTEVDLHTPHWHGNTVVVGGMRMDVVDLLPASMLTADMVPDAKGIWLYHCHVNDHLSAGMVTRYAVS